MKKIILTGGGTVGHISPIIALIEVLKKNSRIDYLYVGSRNGPEKEIAQKNQIKFKGIFVGKRRNYLSFANVSDLFKILLGIISTYFLMVRFKPDVVFAKGGYVTFPVLYWTRHFHIPLVIHESDVKIGKANSWAAQFAQKICVGFPVQYYEDNKQKDKLIYTGIPIDRKFFLKEELKNERPNLLITGGSQGSQRINDLISEIAPELVENYEVYHLCGEKNFKEIESKYTSKHYHLIDYTFQMDQLMKKADLIVSRAGANTLAEISALGKTAILVPLPTAQFDHQNLNAKIYADKNAAVLVSEKNLTASSLLSIIKRLLEDDKFRLLIGHHAKEFATENATQDIIDILFKVSEVSNER